MRSLNQRVLVSASVVLVVFAMITATALDRAFHRAALAAQETRLFGQIYLLLGAAEVDADGNLGMPPELPETRFGQPDSGLYATIANGHGETLWRSVSSAGLELPPPFALAPGEQRFAEVDDLLVAGLGVLWASEHRFILSVYSDQKGFVAEREAFRRTLWGWLAVMVALLLLAQFGVLRWGLRPLRSVAHELSAIESGKQDAVHGDYPHELARLTRNINALLAHERAQQERYRNALGDLAHSLKTPLAVLRTLVTGRESVDQVRAAVGEQVERMDHIVQHQLQRGATAGRSSVTRAVVLRPLVERLGRTLAKVYAEKSVTLDIEMAADARIRADEGDLTEMIGNLLDNAFKWCRARVRLSVSLQSDTCELFVEDDGPGIAEAVGEQLLERGARADESVPGHGIGLAMVRDIVAAYGGTVEISASALGGAGLRVRLPR